MEEFNNKSRTKTKESKIKKEIPSKMLMLFMRVEN